MCLCSDAVCSGAQVLNWASSPPHFKTFTYKMLDIRNDPCFCVQVIFEQNTLSGKKLGVVVVGGGPCDYCVSPSSKNWVFGLFRLGLNEGQNSGHGIWA